MKRKKATWTREKCWECHGYGLVSDYRNDDFYGAMECRRCGGTGTISISSGGAIAWYPGGPFLGRLTKEELTKRQRSNKKLETENITSEE